MILWSHGGSTPVRPVLNVTSHAAGIGEPRQVRKEAAVSRHPWVTWGHVAGAGLTGVFLHLTNRQGAKDAKVSP